MGGYMKIHFLTSKFNGATGGLIYDEILFNKLKTAFSNQVNLITDENFLLENQEESKNYKRFEKIYLNHAKELTDCEYLFVNSRLYTRFGKFPWKELNNNCKVVLIHHRFNYMTQTKIERYLIHRFLELSFLNRADLIITPNQYTMDTLKKLKLGNKSELIEAYISNKLKKSSTKRKNQILFVGTVEPRKGANYGIDAFYNFQKKHPEYKYILAGTFDESNAFCKKLIKQVSDYHIEDKVEFLGRIDDALKAQLFQESKIFLFPSQNEGYGLVMVEAMSYGMPVVAFNNTAMPYTVNNSNGAIVPNRNTIKMTEALEEILSDENRYFRVSEGAKKTVLNLPSTKEIDMEYDALIQRLKEKNL